MSEQPDKLVVTQEARDAAAAHWFRTVEATDANFAVGHHLRIGAADHNELVQAFQRAMKQAADERQEMCAKVINAVLDPLPELIERAREDENTLTHAVRKNEFELLSALLSAIRSIGKGGM